MSNSSIQYHKYSFNKIEPKFNSWGSCAATGTEITEKENFSVISKTLSFTIMPFHQPSTGR